MGSAKKELRVYSCAVYPGLAVLALVNMYSATAQPIQGLENLALLSKGATCLVGTYTVTYDTDCLSTIDGSLSTYHPRPGNGWLTVALDTASMVTAVDIILDWTTEMNYDNRIRLRVIFSDTEELVTHIQRPAVRFDIYRHRVLHVDPVFTKSVTLSWTARKMAAILDINVLATNRGIVKVAPSSLFCNSSSVDSDDVTDGDMTSLVQLVPSSELEASFSAPVEVGWVALYAHPLLPSTAHVPLVIALMDRDGDLSWHMEVQYRNQGWDTEATWQTVKINSFRPAASQITLRAARNFATISELEFYVVDPGVMSRELVWLGDLPYYDLPSGDLEIYDSEPHVVGDMPPRPTTATPETITDGDSLSSTLTSGEGTSTSVLSTRKTRMTHDPAPEVTPAQSDLAELNANETNTTVYTDGGLLTSMAYPIVTSAPWPDFFGLQWYWYVSIGIGAFSIILVIVIIVLISRLKRKTYTPNPRPRIILRSITSSIGDGDALSVVTPTRGFCQLTMNSQSSVPMPYTAFSPVNTTTFGRKDGQGFKFVYDGQRSGKRSSGSDSARRSVSDRYTVHMHDGELSDDCFI